MPNKFAKHYGKYFNIYDQIIKNGKLDIDDLEIAGDKGGKHSYKDQDEANERIYTYLREFGKKNPDNQVVQEMIESFPVSEKFEPNKEDWLDYNQDQMARLAEDMHYNWRNKEDRQAILKELSAESELRNKKKIYEDYEKEHPVAEWINSNIFAPNTSERLSKGEDVTDKDVGLDVLNTASFLTPGVVGSTRLWKGLSLAGDLIGNAALGVANDKNQGRDLGVHNVAAPVFGAGLGSTVNYVPKLAKKAVDAFGAGADAGRVGKSFGDKIEDVIKKVLTDEKAEKAALAKERVLSNFKEKEKDLASRFKFENVNGKIVAVDPRTTIGKPNITGGEAIEFSKLLRKKNYIENPETFYDDIVNKKITDKEAGDFLRDPDFGPVYQNWISKRPEKGFKGKFKEQILNPKAALTRTVKQTGRGSVYTQNQSIGRNENRKERDEESEKEYYKNTLGEQWLAGFKPRGDKNSTIMKAYKEFMEENKAKSPSLISVMGGE